MASLLHSHSAKWRPSLHPESPEFSWVSTAILRSPPKIRDTKYDLSFQNLSENSKIHVSEAGMSTNAPFRVSLRSLSPRSFFTFTYPVTVLWCTTLCKAGQGTPLSFYNAHFAILFFSKRD